ncbi:MULTISPECIES: DUF4190 domain-containing protein [unclassified Isoptericola]|uniref:DUF4190 domain-containing protein n=1 Tax=unclassified Isoptericola TaxID=2623355 RepID=UPI00365C8648
MSAPTPPPSGGSAPDPYSAPDAGSSGPAPSGPQPYTEPGATPSYSQAPYAQPGAQPGGQGPYDPSAPATPYGGQPPYGYAPPRKTDGVSIAALVTGILGLALVPLGLGIAGVVRTKDPARSGRGLAIAGIVLGALSTIGWIVFIALIALVATNDDLQDAFKESYQQGIQEGAGLDYGVGECFDYPAGSTTVEGITPADCTAPHAAEVFAVSQLPGGDYPGEAGLEQAFTDTCVPAFESYVGIDPAETTLTAYYIGPDEVSWAIGDRQLLCVVEDGDGSPLVDSVRGSGL